MARDFLQYRNHYVRDWETSETVRLMSYTARGVYQALLDAQWEKGSIPAEPEVCERLLRCESGDWAHFAPFFDQCFPIGEDGRRRNERLHDDREQAQELVRKKTGAAQKRWGKSADAEVEPKEPESDAPAMHLHSTSKADAMQEQCPTTTTTTTTTTNTSSFPETDPEEEERQPSGLPKNSEGVRWYEEEGYGDKKLAKVAAKVASTRIRSKSNPFPYRCITEADAEKVLEALEPCPSEKELESFWVAWDDYHRDRNKPPYKATPAPGRKVAGVAYALADWASRRAGVWATQARLQGSKSKATDYERPPVWTPGGAA
jgi:uncharacterized protein YdaU (DUF1376 family)